MSLVFWPGYLKPAKLFETLKNESFKTSFCNFLRIISKLSFGGKEIRQLFSLGILCPWRYLVKNKIDKQMNLQKLTSVILTYFKIEFFFEFALFRILANANILCKHMCRFVGI